MPIAWKGASPGHVTARLPDVGVLAVRAIYTYIGVYDHSLCICVLVHVYMCLVAAENKCQN